MIAEAGPRSVPMIDLLLPNGLRVQTQCAENTRIAYDEIFEGRIYECFDVAIADGDTILDVGANIGLAVLWCNERLRTGTVHAFEPIPATFAALTENVRRHNHLDVRLHAVGLADRQGEAEFTWYPLTSTSSSMFPDDSAAAHEESRRFIRADLRRRFGRLFDVVPRAVVDACAEAIRRRFQRAEQVRCPLVRLSDVIDRERIGRVDLLKIDVEGAEFACLDGLEARHWPLVRQAIVEVHDGEGAAERMDSLLRAHGFHTRRFQQSPVIFPRHWLIYAIREHVSPPRAGADA